LNPRRVLLLFRPVLKAGLLPAPPWKKPLNAFSKTLGLAAFALCAAAVLVAAFWPSLHAGFSTAGILLMAANAFAAVGILKLRLGIEPIQLILISMFLRLALVAGIMLLVIALVAHGPALYSFVFSAMAGYIVFQAFEIRHIVRNPGLLAK
jgi:hypothetical protein